MADLNIIKPAQVQTMINKFCCTIGMLPTSYKASLTYEEQILAIGHYLETVVYPAINQNAEALEELQGLFIALKDYVDNYFDNLDVQEEINTKLDAMVEDGTLAEIINQDLLQSINQNISNLQTQQGQMNNEINLISNNLNNNISKTNVNETNIRELEETKADNNDLVDFMNNTNNALYNQYELIGRLQGGTPTVVTDTSQMTDHSKIYVLTTDGKWYYYNGSSFVAGGVYQASEFAANSIKSNSLKNVDFSKVEKVETINIGDYGTPQTYGTTTVDSYTDNSITFSGSGNHGVFFLNFTNVDKSKNYIISADITTDFRMFVSLFEGTGGYKYTLQNIETYFTNKKIYCKITSQMLQNINVPKVLVYGDGSSTVTISNIKVYVENESKLETNLIDTVLNNKPYYENIKENVLETNIIDWTQQGFGSGVSKNILAYNQFELYKLAEPSGSRGITSPKFYETGKKLIIEADVENISQDTFSFTVYIAKALNSFIGVGGWRDVDNEGHLKLVVDMPHYAVYNDYEEYNVWIMLDQTGKIKFSNFKLYFSNISETSIYSEDFEEMVKNIDTKLNSSESTENKLSFINSANKKYYIQATNNNQLQLINVIPEKTLFIGNSLLLGNHHGDYAFGMCATNINNDYYYHITQYIIERNANATFEKLSGTDFEGATTSTQVNNYLNNTLLPKLNNDLQLVIVQLGDNVNTTEKLTMFNTSCLQLLQFIRNNAPNARVVFVGEWYSSPAKQNIILNACNNSGSQFVDISLLNITENQASIGTVITYPDSYTETVTSAGVASHPSNLGFERIANKIINEIF